MMASSVTRTSQASPEYKTEHSHVREKLNPRLKNHDKIKKVALIVFASATGIASIATPAALLASSFFIVSVAITTLVVATVVALAALIVVIAAHVEQFNQAKKQVLLNSINEVLRNDSQSVYENIYLGSEKISIDSASARESIKKSYREAYPELSLKQLESVVDRLYALSKPEVIELKKGAYRHHRCTIDIHNIKFGVGLTHSYVDSSGKWRTVTLEPKLFAKLSKKKDKDIPVGPLTQIQSCYVYKQAMAVKNQDLDPYSDEMKPYREEAGKIQDKMLQERAIAKTEARRIKEEARLLAAKEKTDSTPPKPLPPAKAFPPAQAKPSAISAPPPAIPSPPLPVPSPDPSSSTTSAPPQTVSATVPP